MRLTIKNRRIMKKIYLAPEMEVVEIEKKIQLLAGSGNVSVDSNEDPILPSDIDAPLFSDLDGWW